MQEDFNSLKEFLLSAFATLEAADESVISLARSYEEARFMLDTKK